ncbi:hypothetical protein CLIB1444_01S03532 [[Candida] jaroonii]|uniref:Uncharacterized protein n=1 Tax=[Candida] jaroonii TaxID=467808 RepID=A0ACA9Y045_9ASCO|nr:hypothetical protein CLIB1444_01S03532 [[Candida] jaroonii]
MRSLPPPRITRKRRWRRFKRAIKYFFKTGKLTDPSSPNYRFKSQSISKIKQSRITSRLRRSNFTKSDQFLRSSTNAGMKTASFVGKLVTRSMPVLKPFSSSNSLNVQVRF